MKRLLILTIFSVAIAACIFVFKKRQATTLAAGEDLIVPKQWLDTNYNSKTPVTDRRPPDQTFLTFPEWYLVFSPEEQAAYFKHTTSSTFPFISHTAQIWQSYRIVNDQIKDNFPVNKGYHFMIWVIGTSATAEYSIKAWYETLIGRLTDTHHVLTEEDKFNGEFTQDYVDFIKDHPWYEYDFRSRLKGLWSNTSFFGAHFARKIERKYILTSELFVKYVYGKLIGLGTQTVYDVALPTTSVIIDSVPAQMNYKIERNLDKNSALLSLPRYDKFNPAAVELAKQGITFEEIAGNKTAILISVLTPQTMTSEEARLVFTQPLMSHRAMKRMVFAVPVAQLHKFLLEADQQQVKVEHIFDY